ncbi:hypothetical protein [Pedobacter sp. MC2016-24]|uniref:hypothetical protein n=1 Tax=Pedobacter sp. MC2016-24 TaxID=2780090 RepID=UPI00187F4B92|nr:hypothetical protein [Pedobacter sp. MC2016-24]MBE9601875.1 hypothetical protein [Pedobacter sp. MC2016-24]
MNILKLNKDEVSQGNHFKYDTTKGKSRNYTVYLVLALLIGLCPVLSNMIRGADETTGYIDPNIWLLILISLISFMIVAGLCWWLLQQFWTSMGLPAIESMVLQFKNLPSWQQLGFFWLCFTSLLLAAVGVLTAVL